MDENGLWIALREFWAPGERLIGLPVFLRRLVDRGALELDAATDVMDVWRQMKPTWWVDWICATRDGPAASEPGI